VRGFGFKTVASEDKDGPRFDGLMEKLDKSMKGIKGREERGST
jgi:hypothetical protein